MGGRMENMSSPMKKPKQKILNVEKLPSDVASIFNFWSDLNLVKKMQHWMFYIIPAIAICHPRQLLRWDLWYNDLLEPGY